MTMLLIEYRVADFEEPIHTRPLFPEQATA
jgi:hypothetical protein